MTRRLFGSPQERLLAGALYDMDNFVEEGMSPTQAATKIAEQEKLSSHMIRRLCHGYNIGRQNDQRESFRFATDKYASFDLADPEKVIETVYVQQKRAGYTPSPDYVDDCDWLREFERPKTVKTASSGVVLFPDMGEIPTFPSVEQSPERIGHGEMLDRLSHLHQVKIAQSKVANSRLKAEKAIEEVASYFSRPDDMRMSLAEAEYDAALIFGRKKASIMFDRVALSLPREKRADFSGPPLSRRNSTDRDEPFAAMKAFFGLTEEIEEVLKEASDLEGKQLADSHAAKVKEELRSKLAASMEKLTLRPKKASLLAGALGGVGAGVGRSLTGLSDAKDKAVNSYLSQLEFSDLDDEISRLRSEELIQDMLANDEVISGFDPDTVLKAYNETVQLHPHLADQPGALRPIIRQRLEVDPSVFDISEAAKLNSMVAGKPSSPASAAV